MAWRGVKTRPADAMCRFTSVTGNSSHRLVIRVLPSRRGEGGRGEKSGPSFCLFVSLSSLPLFRFSRRCIFSLRARERSHSRNSGKAHGGAALSGRARTRLVRISTVKAQIPAAMPAGAERARNGGSGGGRRDDEKVKRDGRRRKKKMAWRTGKTRLTRSPGYLAAYRRDIYGIGERRAENSRF